ncbi:futalosine hydrolase [Gorillibacterium timonense]|uniref:futalosine hydrolase n=1 Tax=Gorillibacterium timonense TaxID=1689269 RepID=UPI00071DC596|nr:futalosine hydrolase [Gorillibacterium timonense]
MTMSGKLLVMTAVEAEREALGALSGSDRFEVRLAGVGPIAAAAATASILAASAPGTYSLVMSAGIGGGFPGRAEPGELVVATETAAVELGAETAERDEHGGGFLPLEELGFGVSRYPADPGTAELLVRRLKEAGLPVVAGPVLTVSTITGTAETAQKRLRLIPEAIAEAMEGFGVAEAAGRFGLPYAELRAISNRVGPRDRSSWQMKEAFAALRAASLAMKEAFD